MRNLNNEDLAGEVNVVFNDDNRPSVSNILDGKKSVSVSLSDNNTFESGEPYYAIFLPGTYSNGLTVDFETASGFLGTRVISSSLAFARNVFRKGTNLNNGMAIDVSSISLDPSLVSINIGEEVTLNVNCSPDDATNKSDVIDHLYWQSSNESVASVVFGKVLGHKLGTTTITADYYGLHASCVVNVIPVPVTSISLNESSLDMEKGDTEQLIVSFNPSSSEEGHPLVSWTSSDEGVATVSGGLVTAVGGGTATITATCGGKTATCDVSVTVSTSSIAFEEAAVSIERGSTRKLNVVFTPADASNQSVIFTSTEPSVATVDNEGNVTALTAGETCIWAFSGNNQTHCDVTVIVSPTSFALTEESVMLPMGETKQLSYTYSPSDATETTVTWSSNITSILNVSQSGLVTPVSWSGYPTDKDAVITATMGALSSTCSFKVYRAVESFTLNKSSMSLEKGTTEDLEVTVSPSYTYYNSWQLSSSNTDVAIVTGFSTVEAKAAGTATITATLIGDGRTATCDVTVYVPLQSVSLNKNSLNLNKGQTEQLTATLNPGDATGVSVSWSSSNTAVATVNQQGVVTAVGGGTATITATAGGKKAYCSVNVSVPVSGISLNTSSTTMNVGSTYTLQATVSPNDATSPSVTWTTSNSSVATVSGGVVTANSAGTATITARAGTYTATCSVTVVVPVTGVSLNKTQTVVNRGSTETLTATVSPSNATNKTVNWTSSNTSVATVAKESSGSLNAIVSGKSDGTTIITVTTADGSYTATCTVTVKKPVTSISISNTSLTLEPYGSATLSATAYPTDATNRTLTWTSSNSSVAQVSSTGTVTAYGVGTATITVTNADSGLYRTCTVTVEPKDSSRTGYGNSNNSEWED